MEMFQKDYIAGQRCDQVKQMYAGGAASIKTRRRPKAVSFSLFYFMLRVYLLKHSGERDRLADVLELADPGHGALDA